MSWYDAVTFDLIRHAVGVPLSRGMTATGSHGYFYSLRGAQPQGEGFRPARKNFLILPFLFTFLSSLIKRRLPSFTEAVLLMRHGAVSRVLSRQPSI